MKIRKNHRTQQNTLLFICLGLYMLCCMFGSYSDKQHSQLKEEARVAVR